MKYLNQIDIVKKFYQLVYDDKNNLQADPLNWLYKEFKSSNGLKVLDFGCGDGRHQEAIQRGGCQYFGVDLVSSPEVNGMKGGYGSKIFAVRQAKPGAEG